MERERGREQCVCVRESKREQQCAEKKMRERGSSNVLRERQRGRGKTSWQPIAKEGGNGREGGRETERQRGGKKNRERGRGIAGERKKPGEVEENTK